MILICEQIKITSLNGRWGTVIYLKIITEGINNKKFIISFFKLYYKRWIRVYVSIAESLL